MLLHSLFVFQMSYLLLLCEKKGRDYVRGTLQSCNICLFPLSPGMSSISLDKARVKYQPHLEFLRRLELDDISASSLYLFIIFCHFIYSMI